MNTVPLTAQIGDGSLSYTKQSALVLSTLPFMFAGHLTFDGLEKITILFWKSRRYKDEEMVQYQGK